MTSESRQSRILTDNSKLLERKTEKHEIQMLSCGVELKADDSYYLPLLPGHALPSVL